MKKVQTKKYDPKAHVRSGVLFALALAIAVGAGTYKALTWVPPTQVIVHKVDNAKQVRNLKREVTYWQNQAVDRNQAYLDSERVTRAAQRQVERLAGYITCPEDAVPVGYGSYESGMWAHYKCWARDGFASDGSLR